MDLDLCFLFACVDIDWFQDAWDAESEEENSEKSEEAAKPVKVKKKKTLAQKIAEKEEAAALARQERLAREEEEKQLNTPEGESNYVLRQRQTKIYDHFLKNILSFNTFC